MMEIVNIKLADLKPYENNPRKNDQAVDAVAESIKQCGYIAPIIVDEDNVILAGHTRYKALKKLGRKEAECIVKTGLTEEQKRKYRLLDNKTNEFAEWDLDLLADELEGLDFGDFDFGFDLGKDEEPPEVTEDEYDAEPPAEPKAKLGDIYQLGRHRLMCGDSTDRECVEKLMDGKKADMVFTDPPYGINADKGFSGAGGFAGKGNPIPRRQYDDNWDTDRPPKECFDNMLEICEKVLIFGGNFFTDLLPVGNHWLVWQKNNTMPTYSDAELVWTNIKRNSVKVYEYTYNGLIGKEKERFHPTQKPIKLLCDMLGDYSESGNVICDLFGGSGSTLIACEQLDRICYMMELDPSYVDVIIDRWEKFTGQKAKLISEPR